MVMLASVTRLRVRSAHFLPAFVWKTFTSRRQVERAPGFLGGRLLLRFWPDVLDPDYVGKRTGHEGISRLRSSCPSHEPACGVV